MKHVQIDAHNEMAPTPINPEGETGVIQLQTTYPRYPSSWGAPENYEQFFVGALLPARKVGDEIQLQLMGSPMRHPLQVVQFAPHDLNDYQISPRFYDGRQDRSGVALRFALPGAVAIPTPAPPNEETDLPTFESTPPSVHVAILRWTGVFWLLIAATPGVMVGNSYPHP